MCVFQDSDFTGNPYGWPTASYSGYWVNLTGTSSIALPWGSFNDNSGSSVAFGEASTGNTKCYAAGSRISSPSPSWVTSSRYMYIEYGVSDCTVSLPSLP